MRDSATMLTSIELVNKQIMTLIELFPGNRTVTHQGIADWITFYNHQRPHAAYGGETLVSVYRDRLKGSPLAILPLGRKRRGSKAFSFCSMGNSA